MEDCDPADLFGKAKSEQDIFNFFAKQQQNEQRSREEEEVESPKARFSRK